jgi:TonB family protein
MAAEDADSAEQAITLELYAQFLKARDRAAEAAPIEARAKTIRRSRVNAMGPKEAILASAVRMGPGMKPPTLLYKLEPEYSEEARAAKLAGTVLLKIVVDIDGKAKDIEVVNGIGLGLDEQAVLAIQQWKFKPAEKDGLPLPVMAQIEVNFKLK